MAEIGCGGGMLTNLLAPRTEKLLAIDLSSSMLDRARTRCSRWPHVLFTQFDAHAWTPEPASLDAIVTVATFHHLRADNVLPRWITALRPGGVLLIHDILDRPGLMNLPLNVAAATADRYLRWLRTGSFRTDPAVRAAWATHASFDRLPTIHDVHRFVDTYLPGAHIKHHLLWRYTVRWQKH